MGSRGYKTPRPKRRLAPRPCGDVPEARAQPRSSRRGAAPARTRVGEGAKDENARVRFFAAQSLAKLGKPAPAAAALALLRDNADKDEFIRHAGTNALASNTAALSAAAKDASANVRLAALLALRRQLKPEVAHFRADADPALVKEAARAINDEGIAAAYPQLAALIAKPTNDEQLMLRVINANHRAGTPATAQALATYAAAAAQPEPLQLEALEALRTWAKPFARDRVAGVFRPLGDRDGKPAAIALKSALPKLLASKSSKIGVAAIDAATGESRRPR